MVQEIVSGPSIFQLSVALFDRVQNNKPVYRKIKFGLYSEEKVRTYEDFYLQSVGAISGVSRSWYLELIPENLGKPVYAIYYSHGTGKVFTSKEEFDVALKSSL